MDNIEGNKKETTHHEDRELEKRMKRLRRERFLKPFLAILIVLAAVIFIVMIVWAMLKPGIELKNLTNRDKDITENVRKGIRIEELQAEIDSLNAQIDEYKERISELESRLAITATVEESEEVLPEEE